MLASRSGVYCKPSPRPLAITSCLANRQEHYAVLTNNICLCDNEVNTTIGSGIERGKNTMQTPALKSGVLPIFSQLKRTTEGVGTTMVLRMPRANSRSI